MKSYSVKIGIFKVGFELGKGLQHKLTVWITMEGWKYRAWKQRLHSRKPIFEMDGYGAQRFVGYTEDKR
ncbi:MAG: hypothetical protein WC261_13365 [Synergistaceae bacterium]|jgi:hypothetical protein